MNLTNPLARFRGKLSIVLDRSSCWEWQGQLDKRTGYGVMWLDNYPRFAHRAVFTVVHSMPHLERKQHVCHHCDNRRCVRPSHLKLADAKWNTVDCHTKGKGNTPIGDRNGHAKLSNADVSIVFELRKQGLTHKQIAEKFGVCRQAIGNLLTGRSWLSVTHLPAHKSVRNRLDGSR